MATTTTTVIYDYNRCMSLRRRNITHQTIIIASANARPHQTSILKRTPTESLSELWSIFLVRRQDIDLAQGAMKKLMSVLSTAPVSIMCDCKNQRPYYRPQRVGLFLFTRTPTKKTDA